MSEIWYSPILDMIVIVHVAYYGDDFREPSLGIEVPGTKFRCRIQSPRAFLHALSFEWIGYYE